MSIDNARFPLPPECRAMIRAGVLVVLNHLYSDSEIYA